MRRLTAAWHVSCSLSLSLSMVIPSLLAFKQRLGAHRFFFSFAIPASASFFARRHVEVASLALVVVIFMANLAVAGPQGGVVVKGSATIGQNGAVTDINQSSQKAAINWQSFSIASQETVNFNQPNSQAIALNRVIGNERSVIAGALNANGKIFLINSNEVLFAKGSQVNVGGLVASTLNISDDDFMNDRFTFAADVDKPAAVINQGQITATPGGYVEGYTTKD